MDIKKEEEPWDMDTPGKLCCAVSVQMSGIRTERQQKLVLEVASRGKVKLPSGMVFCSFPRKTNKNPKPHSIYIDIFQMSSYLTIAAE